MNCFKHSLFLLLNLVGFLLFSSELSANALLSSTKDSLVFKIPAGEGEEVPLKMSLRRNDAGEINALDFEWRKQIFSFEGERFTKIFLHITSHSYDQASVNPELREEILESQDIKEFMGRLVVGGLLQYSWRSLWLGEYIAEEIWRIDDTLNIKKSKYELNTRWKLGFHNLMTKIWDHSVSRLILGLSAWTALTASIVYSAQANSITPFIAGVLYTAGVTYLSEKYANVHPVDMRDYHKFEMLEKDPNYKYVIAHQGPVKKYGPIISDRLSECATDLTLLK